MNKWFVKHEKLISILIVSLFVVGIIWWSVGSYLSMNNSAGSNSQNQTQTKENSILVVTKDGQELDYPYWVMNSDLDNEYQNQVQRYEQYYGKSIDPVFDSLSIKTTLVDQLYDLKVILYYSDHNDLTPTKDEVSKRTDTEIDNYVTQLKSNQSNWTQLISKYGSENEIRKLLRNSMTGIETQVMVEKVKDNVTNVTREDVLNKVKDTFDDVKKKYEEVKAQHILVTDEATANKIKAQLDSGELDFAKAAELYSNDTSNATDAGNLGWFKHGDMVQAFEDAAFSAPLNEIVGPVKTQYGYHILRVQDKKVFDKPEDVLNYETIYKEIESTVKDEKFKEWLKNYKADQNFGRSYYNDVLKIAYDYNNNTENIDQLEKIRTELDGIVFYDDGTVSIDSDSDYMAIYINTTKALLNMYKSKLDNVTKYISLNDKVTDEYMNMDLDTLNSKIDEINKKLEGNNVDNENALIDEKMALTDARTYKETLPKIKEMNINSIDQAKTTKTELEKKVTELQNNREAVLEEMFYRYPSSDSVVQAYYQANPGDANVKVAYSKLQINQLKQYANYLGAQSLSSYFGQQIRDAIINISSVISSKAATNTKLDAIEVGLNLSDLLKDDSMRLEYLKQLKGIDPTYYTDIDQRIKDLEDTLNSTNTSTATSTNQ